MLYDPSMIDHPFARLQPFQNNLHVAFFHKGDDIFTDDQARTKIGASQIAALRQMHGNRILYAKEGIQRTEEGDALITDVPGLALAIRMADCQAFVVYAPKQNVIGLIHAGWRGLEAGIIGNFFAMLQEKWRIAAHETYVGAVPSLCENCAEFTDPRTELPHAPEEVIQDSHVDLQRWADLQLEAAGVPQNHLERMPGCTKCELERYWTYRGGDRDAVKHGNTNMLLAVLR